MYNIDDAIAYLQKLKAMGDDKVALRVITKDDLDWNVETRSLVEEVFGEHFDPLSPVGEERKDYAVLRDELWDTMVANIDDNFGGHSDDAVNWAIEYAFGEIEEEEWNNKSYGIGKVIYDIKVKRLMRENECDEESAKVMLAISE